ncbi:MAG: hypothetical protein ACRDTT_05590 [Pseudonocardiaceae bacterium]
MRRAGHVLLLLVWWMVLIPVGVTAAVGFTGLTWYFAADDWRAWWNAHTNHWPTGMKLDLLVQAALTTCSAALLSIVVLAAAANDYHRMRAAKR